MGNIHGNQGFVLHNEEGNPIKNRVAHKRSIAEGRRP
jgi:hypothetical protein